MDREAVITHLQIIHTWAEFARERDLQFFTAKHLEDIAKWSDDAIELLEEQEDFGEELTNAMELVHKKNARIIELTDLLKEQEAVVRCKDCWFFHPGRRYECGLHEEHTEQDGYCSWAKKQDA